MTRRDLCPLCMEIMRSVVSQQGEALGEAPADADDGAHSATARLRAYLAELHEEWAMGASATELQRGILHAMNIAGQIR